MAAIYSAHPTHCPFPRSVIREIGRINDRELDLGGDGISASWHDDYKGETCFSSTKEIQTYKQVANMASLYSDSAYIFVGGLPYDLTEGDVITIFSQ